MSNIFDVGIIGCGVAGVFALNKINSIHKNAKVIAFDIGRPPAKRRAQLLGWMGCLPSSDGKLYLNNLNAVTELAGSRKTKAAYNQFDKILSNVGDFKLIKDKSPNISMEKKLNKLGYTVSLNDYTQIYPNDIHALSKYLSNCNEANKNIVFSFDNEVMQVFKNKNMFTLIAENNEEFKCKKLLIAVGRSVMTF